MSIDSLIDNMKSRKNEVFNLYRYLITQLCHLVVFALNSVHCGKEACECRSGYFQCLRDRKRETVRVCVLFLWCFAPASAAGRSVNSHVSGWEALSTASMIWWYKTSTALLLSVQSQSRTYWPCVTNLEPCGIQYKKKWFCWTHIRASLFYIELCW